MAGLKSIGKIQGLGKIQPLGGNSRTKPPTPRVPEVRNASDRPEVGFRKLTVMPSGPRYLGLRERRVITGGPWPPPAGFDAPSTSFLEWVWYWGSFVALGIDGDPRMGPPFVGYPPIFEYQVPDDPLNPRSPASGVSDFIYNLGTGQVIVRIDSFYYHTSADPAQAARDNYLKTHSAGEHRFIVSAYDTYLLGDPSGRAVVAAVKRALKGEQPINPRLSGLAYPVVDRITRLTP